ncbi:hypothetical protein [Streptomyces sp. H51]|uniref:hypothetical protein n=1 Tax=Streptomyces sp. H51 TaxID=3111770 RepID=UPI002D76DA77|nr:hypothetical protein [Streptomyces sp. H51]
MSMQSLSDRVNSLVAAFRVEIPDYVASGVVDMTTGMLLAVDTVDSHPREVLDVLGAATFDLFQGRNVVAIENMFKERRGSQSTAHYFQEILVNSENLVHLFVRMPNNDDVIAVVVARKTVNIGMLFVSARRVIKNNAL